MTAPNLDLKTILVTNSGSNWLAVGGTSLTPDPPAIATTAVTDTTVTVSISAGVSLNSRIPYRNGTALTAVAGGTTSYQFTGLSANTVYDLWVVDERGGRLSSPSNLLRVTTDNPPVFIPAVPTISFVSKTTNSITVNSAGSTGATSYVPVLNGGALAEVNTFPYTFSGLAPNTSYTLNFRAKNSAGSSANSNTITQTTDATPLGLSPGVMAMCYGGTNWTDQAEIQRRAGFSVIALQFWYGISASMVQTHVNAIRAINPAIKILAYIIFEGTADPGTSNYYNFINNNNFWARDTYPAGAKNSIWSGQSGVNLAGTRKVNGVTCIENLVDLHFTDSAAAYALVDGVLIDNMWIKAGYDYDYDEDGVINSATSTAMRQAQILAYQRAINRIKSYHPEYLFWCNPRAIGEKMQGYDDRVAFQNMKWDGCMNQNAGPGLFWNGEGVFPYDNDFSGFTNYRTYPQESTISSTPSHGAFLRNSWGGFAAHSTYPQTNLTIGDYIKEIRTGNWIANEQNILMECKGFTETEETLYSGAAQHNRVCLGYWWVMTNATPYLFGLDSGTGRSILTTYQQYNWGPWIDPPGYDAGPYVVVSGHPIHVRRTANGCQILNPRYENGTAASAAASITINRPPLPPGKSAYSFWDGSPVGPTLSIPHRDWVPLKAN